MALIPLLPLTFIAFLYARLGKKLGKNQIAWLFVGLGIALTVQLMGLPLVIFLKNPANGLTIWTIIHVISWIIAVIVAYIIAYKNKLMLLQFKNKTQSV
jgi:hypothetical protein